MPRLSARFLASHGFLESSPRIKGFITHNLQVLVSKRGDDEIDIFTIHEVGTLLQHVWFSSNLIGDASVPMLLCPVRDKYCRAIYFDDLYWASADGHKFRNRSRQEQKGARMLRVHESLVGSPDRGPSRGTKFRAALAVARSELHRLTLVPNPWWDLESVLVAQARKDRAKSRRRLRAPRAGEIGFGWAIEHGGAAHDHRRWAEMHLSAVSILSAEQAKSRARAIIEDHAYINLSALEARGWLDSRGHRTRQLAWPRALTGFDWIMLALAPAKGKTETIRFILSRDRLARPQEQVISLVERPNMPGRRFLQCPVRGTPHDRLYLRDGFFASAPAHKLDHRSRASGKIG